MAMILTEIRLVAIVKGLRLITDQAFGIVGSLAYKSPDVQCVDSRGR
jgi:hypothetical protein